MQEIPPSAPLATKIALYRILSEALSNAARHGDGAAIDIRVAADDDGMLVIEVRDKGRGFDPDHVPGTGHLGLAGMRERAELLGGRFELESVVAGQREGRRLLDVVATNGARLRADTFVFACGPWLPRLFPRSVNVPNKDHWLAPDAFSR